MVLGRDIVEGLGAAACVTVSGLERTMNTAATARDALLLHPRLVPDIGLALAFLVWGASRSGGRLAGFEVEEAGHFPRRKWSTMVSAEAVADWGWRDDGPEVRGDDGGELDLWMRLYRSLC